MSWQGVTRVQTVVDTIMGCTLEIREVIGKAKRRIREECSENKRSLLTFRPLCLMTFFRLTSFFQLFPHFFHFQAFVFILTSFAHPLPFTSPCFSFILSTLLFSSDKIFPWCYLGNRPIQNRALCFV